ncbi:thymidine kinase [Roseiconus lacunae]|uniref:Thymidine kinase n=1 Tax=Roseiconus lacunae TaxID=2605694 RepID=A0ABT7PRD4_9BACT|nr:thymidine kinase [Roseiconus lacunae]MCD0463222.1 thymidine kinase [Roseiconus lacunae]MDM4019064.1 thymidine kinase [Roseiconus lacunae]WRQ48623.1 thymidine kinase [Stieleria sp. HD01]
MAKLYFYYSAMNAGKSTILLQCSYNYQERGMQTLILLPEIDTRDQPGMVTSRIGLAAKALTFNTADNLLSLVKKRLEDAPLDCILVDEAQFLTAGQVKQLSDVCDCLEIPVMAYGLRTDFQGNLFAGSQVLLAWADTLSEIKTICHCGRKATMVLRVDDAGRPIKDGRQIQIGGNERYVSVCRRHFKDGMCERTPDELPLLDSLE